MLWQGVNSGVKRRSVNVTGEFVDSDFFYILLRRSEVGKADFE